MRYIEKANHTKIDLEEQFDYLNKKIFNNQLTRDFPLKWKSMKNKMGQVRYSYYKGSSNPGIEIIELDLSTFFDIPEETLINVLIHEMIHVYFLQQNSLEGHGKNFVKYVHDTNRKFPEYDIKLTEDVSDYDVESSLKKGRPLYFIILVRDHSTIMVFKNLEESTLKDTVERYKQAFRINRFKEIQYGQSTNIQLQRFKNSRYLFTALKSGESFLIPERLHKELQKDIKGILKF